MRHLRVCTLTDGQELLFVAAGFVGAAYQRRFTTDDSLTPEQCAELKEEKKISDVLNVHNLEGLIGELLANESVEPAVVPALFGFPARYVD